MLPLENHAPGILGTRQHSSVSVDYIEEIEAFWRNHEIKSSVSDVTSKLSSIKLCVLREEAKMGQAGDTSADQTSLSHHY